MHKKRMITLVAALFIVTGIAVGAVAIIDQSNRCGGWGVLEKEHADNGGAANDDDEAVIKAEHFMITEDELEFLTSKQAFIDEDTAYQTAVDLLIKKKALYYQAQISETIATDEQVQRVLDKNKKIFNDAADENYSAFLSGIEMSIDEYWDSQFDNLKVYESIGLWKEAQYQQFLATTASRDWDDAERRAQWELSYQDIAAEIIINENVQFIE